MLTCTITLKVNLTELLASSFQHRTHNLKLTYHLDCFPCFPVDRCCSFVPYYSRRLLLNWLPLLVTEEFCWYGWKSHELPGHVECIPKLRPKAACTGHWGSWENPASPKEEEEITKVIKKLFKSNSDQVSYWSRCSLEVNRRTGKLDSLWCQTDLCVKGCSLNYSGPNAFSCLPCTVTMKTWSQ